jgi:hypothetical protein
VCLLELHKQSLAKTGTNYTYDMKGDELWVGICWLCKICAEFDTQEVTGEEEGCLGQEVAQLRKDKRKMVQT